MKEEPSYEERYTENFIKAAQYIVRLTAHQDVLEQLGKLMVNYFQAEWVAFAQHGADKEITLQNCTALDKNLHEMILTAKTRETIRDVLDTGFLASETVVLSEPYLAAFLPLTELPHAKIVMLIAHKASKPPSTPLLNLYLALSGIAGSTMGRIATEQELRLHQGHLEELVRERTHELKASNVKLEQEITERKRAEQALRESEHKLRLFVEHAPAAIAMFDRTMRYIVASHRWLTDYDLGGQDIIGRSHYEIFPEIPERWKRTHQQCLAGKTEKCEEDPFPRVDGRIDWVRWQVLPWYEHNGNIGGIIISTEVITERKRAEEALQKAHNDLERRVEERTAQLRQAYDKLMTETKEREKLEAQLRQAQKMDALGTLTGGIAHDFNNILAAMIGFSELAKDGMPEESRDKHHLERVLAAGLRGRELIKQMLTFSRRTEQEKKPLPLSSVIRETLSLLRASMPSTVSIMTKIESEPGLILADPTQIQQVVMNLCTNAGYAMREKGGILDIRLSDFCVPACERSDGMKPGLYMELVVRDTGIGIAPGIIDKIFDPFFTTKEPGEGTGLGLSVVHGIVKGHDGYITVESELGRGSTFRVYFPKVSEERPREVVSDQAIPTGHERVLFIDDEEALMEVGQQLLEKLGYKVTAKNSSIEALSLFTADPGQFDLVVTDQTMPDMTGLELARKLIALRSDIPIILATGFSYAVDASATQAAGIRALVMKPLTKGELARTVRRVLDGTQACRGTC